MAYLISEEGRELLDDVKRFCSPAMKKICQECDITGTWPEQLYDEACALGYHTLDIPEEYGGLGISVLDAAALLEEIAIADGGFAVTIAASGLGLRPVLLAGDEKLKAQACEMILNGGLGAFCLTEPQAGSDVGAITTSAVYEDGYYVLNGRKTFITNGSVASFYTVAAVTETNSGKKGISMFFVDAGTKGVTAENHVDKMGIRTSDTCDVVFEDCRIPESCLIGEKNHGFSIAMDTLSGGRVWMGCVAVGIAQRAMEEAISYGKKREQFGRSILKNQAIRFKIADMGMKIETARQMTAHALTKMEEGLPFDTEASMAKCYSADIAVETALETIQILGGYGYCRDYPAEKLLRDAKIFQIFEGTNEIQRMIIANSLIDG